jgi:hypothetical protein
LPVIVAPVTSSRLVALSAAAWTALAACVSFGAIAFAGTSGSRLGVIPLDARHVAIALLAPTCVIAVGWRRRDRAIAVAVAPLAIVRLPSDADAANRDNRVLGVYVRPL